MFQLFAFLLILAIDYATSIKIPDASGKLEVYALPVGQGDCTIIQCPSGKLVINDCGSSGGSRWSNDEVKNFLGTRVNDIVSIIISHGDRDHYNYLPRITDYTNSNIMSVIISGVKTDYSEIQDWLGNFRTRLTLISGGENCIDNCSVPVNMNFCNNVAINFKILAANNAKRPTNPNQNSTVLKIVYTTFSMLLPGDIEGAAARKIAQTLRSELQSKVYKMAHHGAGSNANSQTWLDQIKPEVAFASSGYNFGRCRHPRCNTIERLQSLKTISTTAASHAFYCGNSLTGPTNYAKFTESMYETSPTANTICLLKFVAPDAFSQDCMRRSAIANSRALEEALDDGCFAASGAASIRFINVTIMIMAYILGKFTLAV